MSRIPSGLLYLAIYNPTLLPRQPVDDDEDAEEQAHILFYTSKERAVSRDRMLRQIGLAKALVNFSELFNANDKCESIHSQSRRMVLVSPESNFWINAAIELPKTLQAPTQSKASGSKGKPKASKAQPHVALEVYDFEDGTVHDIALRSRLLHAYGRFKLLHGSFTSILAELGQEALELQLERFFTVWAWSWNLEAKPQIGEQLGLPLQPYYNALVPLLDSYSATLPETVVPVLLTRTHIVPSNRYVFKEYPSVLAEYLMSMIPPPAVNVEDALASSVDTIQPAAADAQVNSTRLFGLPAVKVNMDVRKWNWQGYLTFGKNSSSPSSDGVQREPRAEEQEEEHFEEGLQVEEESSSPPRSSLQVRVDSKALEDALSSEEMGPSEPTEVEKEADCRDEEPLAPHTGHANTVRPSLKERPASIDDDNHPLLVDGISPSPQSSMTILPKPPNQAPSSRSPSPPPVVDFSTCRVNLSSDEDAIMTQERYVHYYIRNGMMIGLLGLHEELTSEEADAALSAAAQSASGLLDDVELTVQNAALTKLSESLPSANKILQTPDQYAISTEQFVFQSLEFASDSSHLQNAAAFLEKDPDVLEVYARGQNPQYWHVAKRGASSHELASSEAGPSSGQGKAFLEVFRKEASLPDVDNVLTGILRKSGIGLVS